MNENFLITLIFQIEYFLALSNYLIKSIWLKFFELDQFRAFFRLNTELQGVCQLEILNQNSLFLIIFLLFLRNYLVDNSLKTSNKEVFQKPKYQPCKDRIFFFLLIRGT